MENLTKKELDALAEFGITDMFEHSNRTFFVDNFYTIKGLKNLADRIMNNNVHEIIDHLGKEFTRKNKATN
jgi:hypothetical protein